MTTAVRPFSLTYQGTVNRLLRAAGATTDHGPVLSDAEMDSLVEAYESGRTAPEFVADVLAAREAR